MKKKSKYASGGTTSKPTTIQQKVADRNRRMAEAMGDTPKPPPPPPRPKPFASGGSVKAPAKPMTLAERVADRNRRAAEAMGDAPTPKPTPPKKKPDSFADGGPVRPAVMPTPQPRPSNFKVGPLQFGGPGGFGGAGSPVGATGMPPAGPMYSSDRNRPMRDQRDMDNMKEKIKERLGDRMGGLRDRLAGLGQRMRPNAPRPVGPGGGYKKGGKIDGCAVRGMTKGKNK